MTTQRASHLVETGDLVPICRPLLSLFHTYSRWYVQRHFHAMRIAHADRTPQGAEITPARPLIVYINHPSWWDPLIVLLVGHYLLPQHDHYGPMDAVALARYGLFRRMGIFPVEQGTQRGAAQFLHSSMAVLRKPNAVLWITPQGLFTDIRTRPLSFRSGLAALASRLPTATILPIAIEYTYWDERLPEVLVNIGLPLASSQAAAPGKLEGTLEAALAVTQDELAALGIARDPAPFKTLLSGDAGVGGVYQAWQRLRDAALGRRHQTEHGSIRRP